MNITDVGHLSSDADTGEDKMLAGAKREHKTVLEIAKFYTDAFFADLREAAHPQARYRGARHHPRPGLHPHGGDFAGEGLRYEAGGNVYFDTSKLENYYVFGNQSGEDLAVGVRDSVEEDANKRNKADFVLWFTKSSSRTRS